MSCQKIKDKQGCLTGWLLGVAVDQSGKVISKNDLDLPVAATDQTFWPAVETALEMLAGKFIAIILTTKGKRLYLDPVCDLPAVFNRENRIVAASPLLALRRDVQVNPRLDYRVVVSQGGNYGMQQTCDPSVLRMKSNHYLNLHDFTLHRHWPKPDTFDGTRIGVTEFATKAAQRIAQIGKGLLSSYDCNLPISGGNDSRILAYAMKDDLSHVATAYSHHTNWISRFDCYLGAQIAKDLGVPFNIIDAVKQMETGEIRRTQVRRKRREFWWRTGFMASPRGSELAAQIAAKDCDMALRGNILDMAGANQWQRGNYVFDLDHAIAKLRIAGRSTEQNAEYWRQDYSDWMQTVPEIAKPYMYEMAFTELLLPNTLGASLMGLAPPQYVNPFNDRMLISQCMTVNPEHRKRGLLYKALLKAVGAPKHIPRTPQLSKDPDIKVKIDALFETKAD